MNQKEINIITSITPHKHVVKYHDILFTRDKKIALVLEFAKNGTFEKLLKGIRKSNQLDEPTIVKWLYEIFLGFQHLHKNRVIHRDIKPDNILVGSDGSLLITDFGCSRLLGLESLVESSSPGNLHFMAPELQNEVGRNGHTFSADMWSLGVLIYYICTDSLFYEGINLKT